MNTPDTYPWFSLEERPQCCEPQTFIETKDLSVYYHNKAAFEGITLPIYRGCITALVGPSGCGKTSFLASLNRLTDLIPGCRVSGRIRVSGWDVHHPSVDVGTLRRRIGMIFQKPNPFPLTIQKNITFPLREHPLKDKTRVEEVMVGVLKQVGLWDEVKDRLGSSALSLSGGQQQRLCIARALALSPEVLLMDEPCSALDPISSGVVEDLIKELRCQYTIVIVTHNLAQARRIADYTAFFWVQNQVGKLIEYGPAKQIFETPSEGLTSAYIKGMRG
jgi:phosphate transport system ATP-binding protein